MQEAFVRAAASRERELLINPAAWVTTVAKRIAIDAARRDARLRQRLPVAGRRGAGARRPSHRAATTASGCCSSPARPTLPQKRDSRSPCDSSAVSPTDQIADAMLVSHTALSARLTRAKRQIEREGIRFAPVDDDHLLATVARRHGNGAPAVHDRAHVARGRAARIVVDQGHRDRARPRSALASSIRQRDHRPACPAAAHGCPVRHSGRRRRRGGHARAR